tara:strand:- start:157 stop:1242 length:1086 start_codon:yes stop_codon:yes gene_type:complete
MKIFFKKFLIYLIQKFSLNERLASLNKLVNYKVNNPRAKENFFGYFIDAFGSEHKLVEGLRDKIKPGWEGSLKKKNYENIPSNEAVLDQLHYSKSQFKKLERLMSIHSVKISQEMNILEIGAANGPATFQIASKQPQSVVGSDIVQYQINQNVIREENQETKEQEINYTNKARKKVGEFFDKKTKDIVTFIEDDICNSRIKSSSKDLIVSWDTLEHLNNPQKAFKEMFRILKPGGYSFHEYNPFFSFNGGHSLCTLDFMWGHVRLSTTDFQKYLKQFRPLEYDLAMRFYDENLNRMTSTQLKQYIKIAGFEQVMFFPHIYIENYLEINEKIFVECKNNYPSLELIDLVSPALYIGLKKPVS